MQSSIASDQKLDRGQRIMCASNQYVRPTCIQEQISVYTPSLLSMQKHSMNHLALFPGSPRVQTLFRTASDGKLGGGLGTRLGITI